jgi:hypothetical protein
MCWRDVECKPCYHSRSNRQIQPTIPSNLQFCRLFDRWQTIPSNLQDSRSTNYLQESFSRLTSGSRDGASDARLRDSLAPLWIC